MRAPALAALVCAWATIAIPQAPTTQTHEHGVMADERLGVVHFATSCAPVVQPTFERALAWLHSFEFAAAIEGFNATLGADPTCGIAAWGLALSRWGNPFTASLRPIKQLEQGLADVQRAQQIGAKTQRERAYIDAASALYLHFDTADQHARQVAYEQAMGHLAANYPEDREASIFYALSLAASALPSDKTYANQLKAGAILERIFVEEPDHPGVAHYIIHSYDVPALADRALVAARRYGSIAPSAPHALHMPSHTFTRVGAWQESIDANLASVAAARRDGSTAEELHATDYLTYAYLQTGQDAAARRQVQGLREIAARFDPSAIASAAPGVAGVFALAAIPARWVLERRDWAAAAALEPHPSPFPFADALTLFARALGAAHTGLLGEAHESVDALQHLHDRLVAANEVYWAEQVDIEREGSAAFLELAEGRPTEALRRMRAAAVREDATEKNAITPGPLAPARELLGEMLLELNQPGPALGEFQATLQKEPNRFRAVYGVARAARLAGNTATARSAYEQLLAICERADRPGRPELVEARQFLTALTATGPSTATAPARRRPTSTRPARSASPRPDRRSGPRAARAPRG
jgi:tetratricopeptide (TPR) repeat protein